MALLSETQIEQHLQGADWRREQQAIVRELKFEDFAAAIAFVDRVAAAAEAANHHPDILVHGWNKVRLTLCTHSAGGLTDADFALAGELDALAEAASGA
jgi:4a-hydroxytetrahydrobiopterin dehydratase